MKKIFIILISLLLTGCLPDPYQMDIPQGNILIQEEIDQIKIGMSQNDVLN